MFNSIKRAKLKVAGIMFAGIVVAVVATNIDLVQSVQDLWVQKGQTVSLVRTNLSLGIGTTTPLTLGHFESASATSTVTISSGSASSGGRIILEDTDAAGCSEISILNGTIIVETVACPTGI